MKEKTIQKNTKASAKQEYSLIAKKELLEKICDRRCKICSSPYAKEIHEMYKNGIQQIDICKIIKDKYNYSFSPASICGHFKNYRDKMQIISAQILKGDLVEEATKQSVHTKKVVELIDKALEILKTRMKFGSINIDVSDLDKLMRLKYQILSGDEMDEEGIVAIFQKATSKYGFNANQGVLFKPKHKNFVPPS